MTLLLDPDIRDWVVLPLFVIIVVAGLLRSVVSQYLQGAKQPIPAVAQRAQNMLQQTTRIRSSAANYISQKQWHARKQHAIEFLRSEADHLDEVHEKQKQDGTAAPDPMEAMMANPMSMLGGNMVFMVQNMVRHFLLKNYVWLLGVHFFAVTSLMPNIYLPLCRS
jgi:predicted transcriptional regulator